MMAVLRNPFLFVFFVLLAGGGYLVVQAGLVAPMMKIGNAVVDQSIDIARVSHTHSHTGARAHTHESMHPICFEFGLFFFSFVFGFGYGVVDN